MTTYLPRSAWTNTGPRQRVALVASRVKGVAVHWPGTTGKIGNPGQKSIGLRLEGYRRFHRNTRGWFDIAYQVAIDQAGRVWELRGETIESGANGSGTGNRTYGAVLFLLGPGEQPSAAMIQAFKDWRTSRWLKAFPAATTVVGHGDIRPDPTACPGPAVEALIRSRALTGAGSSATPAKPQPAKPASSSKPMKRRLPSFPLPKGHWFGPESRNPRNHSGYWKADRPRIAAALNALRARGWKNVPRTDRYTAAVEELIRKYQADAGFPKREQDGLLGEDTWESIATSQVR